MKRAWATALLCLGCMSHTERTTTTRAPQQSWTGPPVGENSWIYAVLEPGNRTLSVDVGQARLCRHFTDTAVTERRVMEIRASEGRYVGALVLILVGSAALGFGASEREPGTTAFSVAMFAGAGATWGIPLLAERDQSLEQHVHHERDVSPLMRCVARRLADVRVTLRSGGATHEATTDSQGRAVFAGVVPGSDLELFVEDMAVHDVFRGSAPLAVPRRTGIKPP